MSNAISSVASLLWPLVVLAALVAFRKPLAKLINQGDFTVKIAGQEITVGDLARQQTDMITDVQRQLTALQARVAALEKPEHPATASATEQANPAPAPKPALPWGPPEPEPAPTDQRAAIGTPTKVAPTGVPAPHGPAPWERVPQPAPRAADVNNNVDNNPTKPAPAADPARSGTAHRGDPHPSAPDVPRQADGKSDWRPGQSYQPAGNRPKATGVLWVDDHLERHALELDRLQRNGVLVDTADSTDGALDRLSIRRYQLIVSDLRRVENGQRVPDAGLRLTQAVRALDRDTPIVIFTDGPSDQARDEPILRAGATMVTTSPIKLFAELHKLDLV
ncbi:MAG TPA: hypothetical protein VG317_04120 [Pseudonocardiaceae bacterium]|nr:hypothetical protein [Pseudonocardiaceae bacterium]